MKLVSLVGLAAALVGLAAPATNAWTITTANATQPEEVLGPHQTFVKVWTVTGASPVGAIELAAAGSVFIDYDANLNGAPATEAPTEAPVTEAPTEAPATEAPTEAPVTETPTEAPATTAPAGSGSDDGAPLDAAVSFAAGSDKAVAKVVLSGNCTKLLDEIEVVAHGDALKIRFKNNDFSGHGYILTEVVVGEKAALAKISSSGSSGVYVSEGVFAANGSAAAITVSGDGDIFVAAPATDFALASLNVKVSGSGNIQFNAGSLAANESLWTKVSGDATIAVVAKTIKVEDTLNTKISGEGEVYIQADNVQATDLVSKISGDGDITVSTNGSCVSQDISISGTGNVATGSILSENTKLKMSGDGSVLVQTSGTFLVPHEIDGKVQYFGAPPQKITDGREPRPTRPPHPRPPKHHRGWYWGWWDDDSDDDSDEDDEEEDDSRYLPNSVTASPENIFKTYELRAVPAREPTFLVLSINHNRWGSEPNERVVISILGWDIDIGGGPLAAHTQRLAAHIHKQHGPTGVAALGVLSVAAVAAVGVAVHKAVMQRRRRREYQPLLSVVTN